MKFWSEWTTMEAIVCIKHGYICQVGSTSCPDCLKEADK
jgi:hypothetical protein